MARKAFVIAGISMCAAGALGFFTYADDLRHTGELATASGLVIAGISLLAATVQSTLPLQRLCAAILAGLLVGSVLDIAASGLAGGITIGAIATWWRHGRAAIPPRSAA